MFIQAFDVCSDIPLSEAPQDISSSEAFLVNVAYDKPLKSQDVTNAH